MRRKRPESKARPQPGKRRKTQDGKTQAKIAPLLPLAGGIGQLKIEHPRFGAIPLKRRYFHPAKSQSSHVIEAGRIGVRRSLARSCSYGISFLSFLG